MTTCATPTHTGLTDTLPPRPRTIPLPPTERTRRMAKGPSGRLPDVDGFLAYSVPSDTCTAPGAVYRVLLTPQGRVAQCQCADYTRKAPLCPVDDPYHCKHVRRVLWDHLVEADKAEIMSFAAAMQRRNPGAAWTVEAYEIAMHTIRCREAFTALVRSGQLVAVVAPCAGTVRFRLATAPRLTVVTTTETAAPSAKPVRRAA